MVEAMDIAVGKVLKQLNDFKLSDNTIVVFTSDNGGLSTAEGSPTSNVPLRGGKGWIYEGGIRVPWIIRYPNVTQAGSISIEQISSNDLFPTIIDSAGIEINHSLDGINLLPVFKGKKLNRKSLFWHYPHYSNQGGFPSGAIRIGDFKLVERYEDGRVHLYNLTSDIEEKNDLAHKMSDLVTKMRDELHQWYKKVDAQFLQHKENNKPWHP